MYFTLRRESFTSRVRNSVTSLPRRNSPITIYGQSSDGAKEPMRHAKAVHVTAEFCSTYQARRRSGLLRLSSRFLKAAPETSGSLTEALEPSMAIGLLVQKARRLR